ncbi:MAG: tRNA threonylcarbamoyladenosine dehydratase [Janthinobacterium lividum]
MNHSTVPVEVPSPAHEPHSPHELHEPQHEAPDRARRFGGVSRLYGEKALRRFEAAHVVIIGIGGVGSWAAEALARTAVGHLSLVDLDHVAESNTNRQLHALDGNYGKAKITAMAERIRLIDPDCRIDEIDDFITPENFETVLGGGCDYVIDAIDDTRTKTALIAWCAARGQNIITIGGAGGQLDPTRIRIEDLSRTIQDPLLAKVRQQLRQQHGFPRSPKTRFGIAAVYSDEPLRYPDRVDPDASGSGACEIGESAAPSAHADDASLPMGGPAGLNCAGFGSSVCVTASFGLAAAAHVLRVIADAP